MAPAEQSETIKKLAAISASIQAQAQGVKQPWIHTHQADSFFGLVIVLNAIFMGLDIEFNREDFSWPFWIVESIFLTTFLVELLLRVVAAKPKRAFCDNWGIFDTSVTLLGCADAWFLTFILSGSEDNPLGSFVVLRILRLIRLVRLLRVLRMFPELVLLVNTIMESVKAVTWMSFLLLIIMYVGSIMTVMLVGIPYRDSDEDVMKHFGTMGSALFSHFAIITLEGWVDVAEAAMRHNTLWSLYFISVIALTNFCLVNLMIGVIVERIISVAQQQEAEIASFVSESEQFKITLKTLFDCADIDGSGEVTREELRVLLNDPRTHAIMSAFGINVRVPPDVLHTIMDLNHDAPTNFEEFFENVLRLSGSKANVHSVFVQHDICKCHQDIKVRLANVSDMLLQATSKVAQTAVAPPAASAATPTYPTAPYEYHQLQQPYEPLKPAASGIQGKHDTEIRATVNQLLDRMEQFGYAQQHIMAEIHALKSAVNLKNGQPLIATPGSPIAKVSPRSASAARDLGSCCAVDSIHDRPTAMSLAVSGGRLGSCCSVSQEQKANAQVIAAGGEAKDDFAGVRGAPSLQNFSADQVRRGFQAEFQARRGMG